MEEETDETVSESQEATSSEAAVDNTIAALADGPVANQANVPSLNEGEISSSSKTDNNESSFTPQVEESAPSFSALEGTQDSSDHYPRPPVLPSQIEAVLSLVLDQEEEEEEEEEDSSNTLTDSSCLPNTAKKRAESDDEKFTEETAMMIGILYDGVNPKTKKDEAADEPTTAPVSGGLPVAGGSKAPEELPTAALADGVTGKNPKAPSAAGGKKDYEGVTEDAPTAAPAGRTVASKDPKAIDNAGGVSETTVGVESAAGFFLNASEPGAFSHMPGEDPERLTNRSNEETDAYTSQVQAITETMEPGAFSQLPGEDPERRDNITNGVEEEEETFHEDTELAPSLEREVSQNNESDTNLSEAFMINEEEDSAFLMEAQHVAPEDLHQRRKSREEQVRKSKCLLFSLLFFGLLVIFVMVLPLVFLLADSSRDTLSSGNKDSNEIETAPPSLPPEDVVLQLLPEYTLLELQENEDSPQAMAYKWIVEDPNLRNYTQERIIQRFALATLYHSTNGPGWANSTNWMSYDHHECQWHTSEFSIFFDLGLFDVWPTFFQEKLHSFLQESPPCDEDPMHPQMYSHLWLFLNNLQGTIPREIFLLTTLKSIWLGPDQFMEAVLPPELGELSLLEAFSMTAGIESFRDNTAGSESIDKGAGNIPTEIGLLSNLWFLWLPRNRITGTIPTQLGLLSDKLTVLDLGENLLTGGIPTEIGSLENLSSLGLYLNPLSGTIPTELGRLQVVKIFALPASNLYGTIPSELGMLQAVLEINLGINGLTGTVPVELTKLVTNNGTLEQLHVWINNLSGSIPEELCQTETVSDYNEDLIGCNCTCSFFLGYDIADLSLCSPLLDRCLT